MSCAAARAGSAIAAKSTNLCVQLCLAFSCRRCLEAAWSIVFHTKFSGVAHHSKLAANVSMTLQFRIFNSISFYFCSCSCNATFLHFAKENRRFLLWYQALTISLDIFLSPYIVFSSSGVTRLKIFQFSLLQIDRCGHNWMLDISVRWAWNNQRSF